MARASFAVVLAAAAVLSGTARGEERPREPWAGMDVVRLEGGTFDMGDIFGDGRPNERPVHQVRVSSFQLGRTEVTVAQFRRFADETGYRTAAEKAGFVADIDPAMGRVVRKEGVSWRSPGFPQADDHPVTWVTWEDATAFTAWLAAKTGKPYRLPTEAEWEYAARSGGRREKWAGVPEGGRPDEHAWYAANSGGTTHPVGTKSPNGLGIYDLSGNVWEWCLDSDSEYRSGAAREPAKGEGSYRALRGGSWRVPADIVRVFYRSGYKPDYAHGSIGFRVAAPEASP